MRVIGARLQEAHARVPISRQDIAEMTGSTLHTVSRILSAWEAAGIVDGGRQRLLVKNPPRIMLIANGAEPGLLGRPVPKDGYDRGLEHSVAWLVRAEAVGPFHQIEHMAFGVSGQLVRPEAGARGDESRPLPNSADFLVRGPGKQRDQQVLKRNDPNAQLHEFRVGQRRQLPIEIAGRLPVSRAQGAAFILPAGKRPLPPY
jgi:hypothetical protein